MTDLVEQFTSVRSALLKSFDYDGPPFELSIWPNDYWRIGKSEQILFVSASEEYPTKDDIESGNFYAYEMSGRGESIWKNDAYHLVGVRYHNGDPGLVVLKSDKQIQDQALIDCLEENW